MQNNRWVVLPIRERGKRMKLTDELFQMSRTFKRGEQKAKKGHDCDTSGRRCWRIIPNSRLELDCQFLSKMETGKKFKQKINIWKFSQKFRSIQKPDGKQ